MSPDEAPPFILATVLTVSEFSAHQVPCGAAARKEPWVPKDVPGAGCRSLLITATIGLIYRCISADSAGIRLGDGDVPVITPQSTLARVPRYDSTNDLP